MFTPTTVLAHHVAAVTNVGKMLPVVREQKLQGMTGWGACAQLSPECMDLLNKIFVINQDQRTTLPNIKAHPRMLTGRCACAQLSPECMDLLNKIFVINQDQRITVPNIKAHPWYTKPLLAKYQAAEETLAARQEQLNAYVSQRQLNSVRPRP